MTPLYVNRLLADDDRRSKIFGGGIFVYSALAASKALIDWGRGLILLRRRIAPPVEYPTAGVSSAYKPHRDAGYAHPRQLVNDCSPMFDAETGHVMPMYVQNFGKALPNESEHWDYDDWVKSSRYAAASNVGAEARKHPLPSADLGAPLEPAKFALAS